MLDSGRECHVVNVASLAGVIGGAGTTGNRLRLGVNKPHFGAMYGYLATKHAVVAISETLAGDLRDTQIGVSVLCPAHHEHTGIWDNSARYRPQSFGGPMTKEEIDATGDTSRRSPLRHGWCSTASHPSAQPESCGRSAMANCTSSPTRNPGRP